MFCIYTSSCAAMISRSMFLKECYSFYIMQILDKLIYNDLFSKEVQFRNMMTKSLKKYTNKEQRVK